MFPLESSAIVCACMNSPTWWPGRPKLPSTCPLARSTISICSSIAYVHQAIITHADAMHGWRSRGACLLRRSVQFPLAQVVSGLIKHHDAKIIAATSFRMSIGDVNVAIVRVESDFRHPEKLRRARVQGRAGNGAV